MSGSARPSDHLASVCVCLTALREVDGIEDANDDAAEDDKPAARTETDGQSKCQRDERGKSST